jgi:transposase
MINITLTKEEKSKLELRHKKCRDKRECDRIKAVLLSDEGWSSIMIAQALRKHEASIVRHLNDYIQSEKLNPQSGGCNGCLSEDETQELIQHLCEKTYLHQHQIIAYIKETYGVEYTVSGLNKWLHRHDFSYKKPKGVPHKFDEEKQAEFIKYYEVLKNSLDEDEPLLFMDAVHPTQATKITAGWIKKGVDKPIETTGSRTRLNIVGAIRLGCLSEMIVDRYDTVNGDSIIEFLNTTRDFYSTSSAIHLVLDGAGYHRSLKVVEEAEKLNIKLHYLPPYSPNLNPIERLWKVMNNYARNNHYFSKPREFRASIDQFFRLTLPDIAESLDGTINDNFQKLTSATPTI